MSNLLGKHDNILYNKLLSLELITSRWVGDCMNLDQALQKMKILYVEDEEITQKLIKKLLSKYVGRVITASNGEEGLALFAQEKPDLIITDLKMPQMDGMAMIKKLRQMDLECFIIVYSELEDLEVVLKSVDMGIEKYWVKPLTEEEIVSSLQSLALKFIKKHSEKLGYDNILMLDRPEKLEIEDKIKKVITGILKRRTGKGPMVVQVFVLGKTIDVVIKGTLTQMEKSLAEDENNLTFINFNRQLFYNQFKDEICDEIKQLTDIVVTLDSLTLDANRDEENLKFFMTI